MARWKSRVGLLVGCRGSMFSGRVSCNLREKRAGGTATRGRWRRLRLLRTPKREVHKRTEGMDWSVVRWVDG